LPKTKLLADPIIDEGLWPDIDFPGSLNNTITMATPTPVYKLPEYFFQINDRHDFDGEYV
jgi:hypothetical protein